MAERRDPQRPARRAARSRRTRRARLLWRLLLVLAGVLVVATALPLGFLSVREPPATAFMLRSRLADPATGRACPRVEYRWVDWEQIAPSVRRAVVVAEDQRFLEHNGFDLVQLRRALGERRSRVRGASTITQQLAKNLFLWPGRSFVRKGLEAWYAGWMELLWSKRRILELYLNVAQFGPCVFGVESASLRFFGCHADELTREEAALLAAVLPSPAHIQAHDPGPYAVERTREILSLMEAKATAPWLRGL